MCNTTTSCFSDLNLETLAEKAHFNFNEQNVTAVQSLSKHSQSDSFVSTHESRDGRVPDWRVLWIVSRTSHVFIRMSIHSTLSPLVELASAVSKQVLLPDGFQEADVNIRL